MHLYIEGRTLYLQNNEREIRRDPLFNFCISDLESDKRVEKLKNCANSN